ncbi:hypothetical protein VNO77_23096 [Canavalia gladiata]|uniref:Uncharacterized protein n=1 Tax=Canavalia gladiata TaxID=3824 RepID=A0AAN9QB79_CANGL
MFLTPDYLFVQQASFIYDLAVWQHSIRSSLQHWKDYRKKGLKGDNTTLCSRITATPLMTPIHQCRKFRCLSAMVYSHTDNYLCLALTDLSVLFVEACPHDSLGASLFCSFCVVDRIKQPDSVLIQRLYTEFLTYQFESYSGLNHLTRFSWVFEKKEQHE